jgi:hypothetical protein
MGFFGSIITATVKIAMAPVAVVMDAVTAVVKPKQATHTKQLFDSAAQDVKEAMDDIT